MEEGKKAGPREYKPRLAKPMLSVFDQPAWIVDNDLMRALESGAIRPHQQYEVVILTFTADPKKWGTLLSKVIAATKGNGTIYFPSRMSDHFLLVGKTVKRAVNAENFWKVDIYH